MVRALAAAVVMLSAAATRPVALPGSDGDPVATPCAADHLEVRVERGDGRFTGMSHDGAIVIVRNVGNSACTLPALPTLQLLGPHRTVLARGEPRDARYLHPGPVVSPLRLEPGAVAASTVRWIAGNVFGGDAAHRLTSTALALEVGEHTASVPFAATLWTRSAIPATFTEDRFTTALPALGQRTEAAPGTYVGEGPAGSTDVYPSGQPARRLVLHTATAGTIAFTFEGLGGFAPSSGSLAGVMSVRGGRARFADSANDCVLEVTFYGAQLTVVQRGRCGFGNGVTAGGQYRRRR